MLQLHNPAESLLGYFTMSKMGFSVAVLATTAIISFGSSFKAFSQPAAAPQKKLVSIPAELSARRPASATQVYLMRGFLNVFSLGMDSLARELRGVGISATVANHTEWQEIASEIAADYKAGRRGPIVLVGHSFGADAVMSMGEYLGQQGVPVALIVPFDGTSPHAATANVARVLNLYKSESVKITRGPGFHGELTNYYVSDANVTHMNIDDDSRLHAMVIGRIRGTHNLRSAAFRTPGTSG
jgi:pimeloyl-ACP methyl ester carboxylesterase